MVNRLEWESTDRVNGVLLDLSLESLDIEFELASTAFITSS